MEIDIASGKLKSTPLKNLPLIIGIMLVCMPAITWALWGRERRTLVPEHLHTLPDKKLAPWQVDVLTNGKGNMSENGMASIILELEMAGVLNYENSERGLLKRDKLLVTISKDHKSAKVSAKARTLVEFILTRQTKTTTKGTVCELSRNTDIASFFNGSIRKNTELIIFFKEFYRKGDVKTYRDSLYDRTGIYIFFTLLIIFLTITLMSNPVLFIIVMIVTLRSSYLAIGGASLLLRAIPISLFSRFKEDNYRKYQEWLSFKNMLDDFAQIKKYSKEDYSQWKEWLLYATALGSPEKLLKGLKELDVLSTKEFNRLQALHTTSALFAQQSMTIASPKGSGHGGGGFGGGFGGGGGGGR